MTERGQGVTGMGIIDTGVKGEQRGGVEVDKENELPLSGVSLVRSSVLLSTLMDWDKASFRFISPSLYSCFSSDTAFCAAKRNSHQASLFMHSRQARYAHTHTHSR